MTHPNTPDPARPTRVLLYGAEAGSLQMEVARHPALELVTSDPDIVVCFGGDGTLLAAELEYPGLPKVPILNSLRGHRCIPHPPAEVIEGLAKGALASNEYTKLSCDVYLSDSRGIGSRLTALNEFSVHMGRINSAVRFKMFLNDEPYDGGIEILGDGFLVCTPFGSTAYFNKLTRGVFTKGIGIAFKATTEHTNHLVLPSDVAIRILITRGPAQLAYDSSMDIVTLEAGDELLLRKHIHGATILTCGPVKRLDEPF
ncbi:MAG: hypothetical protein GC168_10870 [Candidatus Hydrogenedens sp.]|nr:hypothetical protein [Candidatus Hydrogenedens sp.]